MIRWAIKRKDGSGYIDISGDPQKDFDGVRLFNLKKDVVADIATWKQQDEEYPVKIEIKEIK